MLSEIFLFSVPTFPHAESYEHMEGQEGGVSGDAALPLL